MVFEPGQRVKLPREPDRWVTIDYAYLNDEWLWTLYVASAKQDIFHQVTLTLDEAKRVPVLTVDGGALSARALAAMWTNWMSAATSSSETALQPFPHQIT